MGCIGSSQFNLDSTSEQSYSELIQFKIHEVFQISQQNPFHQTNSHLQENTQFNVKDPNKNSDTDLIKQIDFAPLIEQFKAIYPQYLLNQLAHVKRYDIKTLEIVIRALYTSVIQEKLISVNRMEINMKKCKVHIAQSMLSIILNSINFTVKNYSTQHANAMFNKLQKFSKTLCTFLKTKYPRGQDVDAGKLGKQFKQFDCTDAFQHDIIANAQVVFKTKNKKFNFTQVNKTTENSKKQPKIPRLTEQIERKKSRGARSGSMDDESSNNENDDVIDDDKGEDFEIFRYPDEQGNKKDEKEGEKNYSDDFEITNNIKILLNRLMDEIDDYYLKFCEMFKTIHPDFKVSRKISENTAKCSLLDTGVVEINSIEVVRVLVKWLQNLEEFISKPQEPLTSNYEIKVTKYPEYNEYSTVTEINESKNTFKNNIKYSKSQSKQLQKLLNEGDIIEHFERQYKKLIINQNEQKYQDYFKEFSTFILKNLQHVLLDQRQISFQQTQIVKYSYEMTSLISWMIEQKLISVIESLTKVAEMYKLKRGVPNFIKFKVNDLMRCQLSGDQKTIQQTYKKILIEQAAQNIEIVKIKNRFHSDNHDAVILFKMKGSFLICECQLALEDQKYKNDSRNANMNANIYELNHFLYQLQRSPFGIVGQLCIFLKTQSHTVSSYYNKLKLKPSSERLESIKQCFIGKSQKSKVKKNTSPQMSKLTQCSTGKFKLRPYVCSVCYKYFHKFANFSKTMSQCIQCVTNVCEPCQMEKIVQQKKKTHQDKKAERQRDELKQIYKDLKAFLIQMANQNQNDQKLDSSQEVKFKLETILQPLLIEYIRTNAEQQSKKFKEAVIQQMKKKEEDQNLIQPDAQKEKEIESEQKRQTRLKAEDLMKYFQRSQTQAIKKGWKIHFTIFSKIANKQKLSLYRYDSYEGVIQNVYCPIEKYLKHEVIKLNQSARIFTFKNVWRTSVSKKQKIKNQLPNIPEEGAEEETQKKQSPTVRFDKQTVNRNEIEHKQQNNLETSPRKPIKQFNSNTRLLEQFQRKASEEKISSMLPDAEQQKSVKQGSVKIEQNKNKDDKIQQFKEIIQKSIQPFEHQQQMKLLKTIKPHKHQFYFVQYNDETKDSNSSIYILIDTQISKGNKQGFSLLSHLSKFSIIKNLKKKIDLSNLGISSDQLYSVKKLSNDEKNKKTGSRTSSVQKTHQTPLQWIKKVVMLDLSKNKLRQIKILPKICPDLEFLDISQNSIQNLQNLEFKILKQLKAEDNLIMSVKSIKSFKQLVVVNLSQNRIKQFLSDTQNFSIKEINISRNFINTLQYFTTFRSLQILIADKNYVENLDGNSFSKKLKTLSLGNNKLKEVKNLDSLQNLQKINIEANKLVKFKIEKEFPKLQSINLSSNSLVKLRIKSTGNIRQMYLDEMNLTDQKLAKMVFGDKGFEKLQILSVKRNKLTKFPNLQELLTQKIANYGFRHPMKQKSSLALKELRISKNTILFGLKLDLSVEIFEDFDFLDEEQDEEIKQVVNLVGQTETNADLLADIFQEQIERRIIEQSPVLYSSNLSMALNLNAQKQYNNQLEQNLESFETEDSFFDFLNPEPANETLESQPPQPEHNQQQSNQLQAEQPLSQEQDYRVVYIAERKDNEDLYDRQPNQKSLLNHQGKQKKPQLQSNQLQQYDFISSNPLLIKPKQDNEDSELRKTFQFINNETQQQINEDPNLATQHQSENNNTIRLNYTKKPQIFDSPIQNTQLQQIYSPPAFQVPPQIDSPQAQAAHTFPDSQDYRSNKSSEGYAQKQEQEKDENQVFQQNLNNIKWLLNQNVQFQIPVEQNLFRSKHNDFYKKILKIIKELQPEREKLRFAHFSKRQADKNRRDQNFFKQRPQTKVSKINSTLTNKNNSKTLTEIDFAESDKYIYLKRVLTEMDIPYYYVRDQENATLFKFWHPDYDIKIQDFFVFDWSLLVFLDIRCCQINDEKWAVFSDNAEQKLPNLKKVNLSFNEIRTVTISQLQKFIAPGSNIWFYDGSGYRYNENPLTNESQAEIKKFNQEQRGKRWGICNYSEMEDFKQSLNRQEQGKDE